MQHIHYVTYNKQIRILHDIRAVLIRVCISSCLNLHKFINIHNFTIIINLLTVSQSFNRKLVNMVRVMSIFHFASQTIQQLAIEELSAACLINQDYIALAKNFDHTIEIRKLSTEVSDTNGSDDSNSTTIKSFSSVDDVQQLFYSNFGNFLISVEGRISNYEKAEIR